MPTTERGKIDKKKGRKRGVDIQRQTKKKQQRERERGKTNKTQRTNKQTS